MNELLRFDPARRPSASQAVRHEWFGGPPATIPGSGLPSSDRPPRDLPLDEILGALLMPEENVANRPSALAVDRDAKSSGGGRARGDA
jgi:hypothetical protein